MNDTITDVPGIKVGHAQNEHALTGCTVLLFEDDAVAGVDQRGGAPGTRETDALRPMHLVERIHAVMLAGGSAFGLDAAAGVMQYLEENGIGFQTGPARVPVVAAAILYDLGIGSATIRPDAKMGYQVCKNATAEMVAQGNVGAGMGAAVGKILGIDRAVKAGLGSASLEIQPGLYVGAIAAVNAVGDVIDPSTGVIIAGPRGEEPGTFLDTLEIMRGLAGKSTPPQQNGGNTVIGVVATNATLTKSGANKMAQMAQNGLAKTIRPAHTMLDGDTIFAVATCRKDVGASALDISTLGAFAAEAFSLAVTRAIQHAKPAGGLPAAKTW